MNYHTAEHNSSGHAKDKRDRFFNRGEALSAPANAAGLKLKGTRQVPSAANKFMT